MPTLRENIVHALPKAVSNIVLALIFWFAHFAVQQTLNPIDTEQIFIIQTGLLIVSGIFLVRALFNGLTIADHLTKSLLKRLGINEKWSRKRILKDLMFIIAVILVAAGLYPIISLSPNYEQVLQQIVTYSTLGFLLLFVFDIGRIFYRITENRANSVAIRFSNILSKDEEINEQ
jgi:hypothetical protein